jgi:beta-glucosidase
MDNPSYLNPDLPIKARVRDLIARMTLDEKISQMMNAAPAIPRLGIPAYDWWNECLHGVGRAGAATVFPQAIGLAAAWDVPLIEQIAAAISDEARAKHHEALRRGDRSRYTGLTYWSPNVNIFRDPRWGRGQETYGEDPYLTARLGVAFVRGLQGDDPHYLKLVATPKHFAVHSGPEHERHAFDAQVSERDLRETYLPAFQACVQEGRAVSIMGAYSRTNGEPCCASPTLLDKILREDWGFGGADTGGVDGREGFVVSDCGAIRDIYTGHQVVATPAEAAALAVNAGCDLECGDTYRALGEAVQKGLVDEAALDRSLERLFTARFRLGMFDPPERVPYAQIPFEVNDCPAHRELALQAARESIVLLKNNGLLPLKDNFRSIAVIGPNADQPLALLGNYQGTPSFTVTPLEGIRRRAPGNTRIESALGCELLGEATSGFAQAVDLAVHSDLAVLVLGLSQQLEGEEGQTEGIAGGRRSQGDRQTLDLPGVQEELLKAVAATGVPVVLVLLNGSPLALNWADEHIPAILEAWYPGQSGGIAIAEAIYGDFNPAGRLPVTFYRSVEQLPPFRDYRMQGRTYRFFHGEPLYPFGFGLSYTRFRYRDLQILPQRPKWGEEIQVQVVVENSGQRAGDEVVQLYLLKIDRSEEEPAWQLNGFERIALGSGEAKKVSFTLQAAGTFKDRLVKPGSYRLAVGGCSPASDSIPQQGSVSWGKYLMGAFKILDVVKNS